MKSVPSLFVVVVVFGTIIVLLTKYLQVLELGDEFATTLGKTKFSKSYISFKCTFLIAFAAATTGPIAFLHS